MAESTEAIAARCLEDPAFARQVLAGDDYPAVRSAIIADLEEARDVEGYLNPQPLPPGPPEKGFGATFLTQQDHVWHQWSTLRRANVRRLMIR